MDLSPAFKEIAMHFFQDLDRVATTEDEMYNFVLAPFRGPDKQDLRNDLDTILNSNLSDIELKAFWRKTDADIV